MTVTEEEYRLLQAWSDVRLYLPRVEDLKENGDQVFDAAIRQAESVGPDLRVQTVRSFACGL